LNLHGLAKRIPLLEKQGVDRPTPPTIDVATYGQQFPTTAATVKARESISVSIYNQIPICAD
jgi:hypothetical protein